jgi:hypothetical protein
MQLGTAGRAGSLSLPHSSSAIRTAAPGASFSLIMPTAGAAAHAAAAVQSMSLSIAAAAGGTVAGGTGNSITWAIGSAAIPLYYPNIRRFRCNTRGVPVFPCDEIDRGLQLWR